MKRFGLYLAVIPLLLIMAMPAFAIPQGVACGFGEVSAVLAPAAFQSGTTHATLTAAPWTGLPAGTISLTTVDVSLSTGVLLPSTNTSAMSASPTPSGFLGYYGYYKDGVLYVAPGADKLAADIEKAIYSTTSTTAHDLAAIHQMTTSRGAPHSNFVAGVTDRTTSTTTDSAVRDDTAYDAMTTADVVQPGTIGAARCVSVNEAGDFSKISGLYDAPSTAWQAADFISATGTHKMLSGGAVGAIHGYSFESGKLAADSEVHQAVGAVCTGTVVVGQIRF